MKPMSGDLHQRAQRLVDVLSRGKEFIEEILCANERLAHDVSVLENSVSSHQREALRLQEQLQKQESERNSAANRMRRIEDENRQFAGKYVELEQQNSNLANLYVASHQLHSTLDLKEVLQIVQEIVINFIGSECFAILLSDEETGDLRAIATEGSTLLPGIAGLTVRPHEGQMGQVTATGESYFTTASLDESADIDRPLAVVPLKIKDRVIGLLVIYKLFQQKRAFSPTDYELFSLLAGQAATAIFSAKVYSDAERKLNTIQGFIESLTTA